LRELDIFKHIRGSVLVYFPMRGVLADLLIHCLFGGILIEDGCDRGQPMSSLGSVILLNELLICALTTPAVLYGCV